MATKGAAGLSLRRSRPLAVARFCFFQRVEHSLRLPNEVAFLRFGGVDESLGGDNPSGKSVGGWVECRFTYGFAFEADYSAFLDAVNNGALYELPFTVSIEGA